MVSLFVGTDHLSHSVVRIWADKNVASATSVMLRWPRAAESYGRCGSTGRAKSTKVSGVEPASHFQKKSWEESRTTIGLYF